MNLRFSREELVMTHKWNGPIPEMMVKAPSPVEKDKRGTPMMDTIAKFRAGFLYSDFNNLPSIVFDNRYDFAKFISVVMSETSTNYTGYVGHATKIMGIEFKLREDH